MSGFDPFGVPFRGTPVLADVPGTVVRHLAVNCVLGAVVRLNPCAVTGAPAVEVFVPLARITPLNENGTGTRP